MAKTKETTPQQIKQQKFSAEKIYNQARVQFAILGQKTADPRLAKACNTLGLPDPTTEKGLRKLQRIEEAAREAAAAARKSSWNY